MRHNSKSDFLEGQYLHSRRPQNQSKKKKDKEMSDFEIALISNQCRIFVSDTKRLCSSNQSKFSSATTLDKESHEVY